MANKYLLLTLVLIFTSVLQTFSQFDSYESTVLGYNLYRNNEKLNTELITDLKFQDNVPETGEYSYYVTAVYSEGESGSSNSVEAVINLDYEDRQYVVFEKGTGTWCSFCPAAANGLDELHDNGKKVLGIAYHANDNYSNADAAARLQFYGISGYPTAYFDGVMIVGGGGSANQSKYKDYLLAYEQRMAIKTAIGITATGTYSSENYTANVNVESFTDVGSENLKLMAVIVEDHIEEEWLGLSELNAVARKMLPDANGTTLSLNTDTQQNLSLEFSLDSEWAKEYCSLIVFVQNMDTKEIYEGNVIELSDFVAETKRQKFATSNTLISAYDLTVEYSMFYPTVTLSWKEPQDQRWLQWGTDDNRFGFGSSEEPLIFDVAAKWDVSDLRPLDGFAITKIAFAPFDASCEFTLKVWEGESDENLLVDSLLESVNDGEWNEIILEEALKVDITKPLWLGYHNKNIKNRRSAGVDEGPVVDGKGNKVRIYNDGTPGDWQNLTAFDLQSNWNIKAYIEPYSESGGTLVLDKPNRQFSLYPNPTFSNLTVSSDELINTLYVISVNGQVVMQANPESKLYTFNVNELNTGVYFVKIVSSSGFGFKKLVVK